ncbi:hypothetical protein OF83DRAFT_815890 [Amylostereum chailletii]|nr:hypothetical protein OF83DRAFT_815890 [Amylostereum chailletii]
MRDPTSWPSRKKFWMKNARARLLFNCSFHLSEEVEDEIDALEDLLAQVKRFRNDCKPAVSRLPTEILVAIFLAAHEDDISERFMDQDDTGPRHWLSVAQVCHHWREVSMHTQCLWTDVLFPPMTRQFAQETANRAGSMPLSVYYCYSESAKHKDAYVRGICDVDDIQPNRLRFMHAEIGDETCPTLERPLPSLESLRLTNKSGSYRIRIVGDLDTLFPRLSSLRIHNCVIPWDSTVFSQLSHLSLSFYPHYHLLSLEEINDLFRQLSRVESMSIQHLRFYTATSLVVLPTSLLSLHITERKNADEGFNSLK